MRPRPARSPLVLTVVPALMILLGCSAKGVKETRAASTLAVKELQSLVDDATENGLKERERARSEEPLDWALLAATAIQQFQASPDARALRNPYDAARPVYAARAEGSDPGTVYLDATPARSGTILVIAVFKDGTALRRETSNVKVNVARRPPKLDVDTGAMPAAPNL